MKRIIFSLIAILLWQAAIAGDWTTSTQAGKDGGWSKPGHSTFDDYMEEVSGHCNALGLMAPWAIKVTFPNGDEKVFICNDIRAEHGLPLMPY
jgi:hypothetical protein